MVSIDPQGHHDHPARDPSALAPGRLPKILAVEIPLPWRPAASRRGPARADPADERRKSGVGSAAQDRKSTRLNSSHVEISYAVFCLKKKSKKIAGTDVLDATRPGRLCAAGSHA